MKPEQTAFLESLHHAPAAGWTAAAYSVLRAGKVAAAADYGVRRAFHPGQDILFCLSGAGTVETRGERLEVKAGQLVWIANETPHSHSANRRDPWTLLWFRLDGPNPVALRQLLFAGDTPRLAFAEGDSPALWFERLFAAMRRRDFGLDLRLNLLVAEFIGLVDRHIVGTTSDLPPPLARVTAAMRDNVRLAWAADDLSAVTGVGHSQTRRLFRRHLRTSPRQWLIGERLLQAEALLTQERLPVSEIAELCGFSDVYHLSREFKRSRGVSPKLWRQRRS